MTKERTIKNRQPALLRLADELGFSEQERPLLQEALTHPAYFEGCRHDDEGDNQRLEFLGDAVLDLVIGDYLFRAYPNEQEGVLSKMRAYIVCEASLAEAAKAAGIDAALRLGRGSEAAGDRGRASVLADAYEAVLGAVYFAHGITEAERLLHLHFGDKMDHLTADEYEDKKSRLQEIVQAHSAHGVHYKLLESGGPDHHPHFRSGAYCNKLLLGEGMGNSKKESETAAAEAALSCREQWLETI